MNSKNETEKKEKLAELLDDPQVILDLMEAFSFSEDEAKMLWTRFATSITERIDATRAKMQKDQEEIDRLKSETRNLISKMMAA